MYQVDSDKYLGQYLELLKDFGCHLTDDEVQDVRRNYQDSEGHLLLYPIYQSFVSLFQGTPQLPTNHMLLFRMLMTSLVKDNCTLADLSRISTASAFNQFLTQLLVFTPI